MVNVCKKISSDKVILAQRLTELNGTSSSKSDNEGEANMERSKDLVKVQDSPTCFATYSGRVRLETQNY